MEDLDIINVISKLKECHDMMKHVKVAGKKNLLKYNGSRVVEVESTTTEEEKEKGEEVK